MLTRKKYLLLTFLLVFTMGSFFYSPSSALAEKYKQTVTIDNRQVNINIPDNVTDDSSLLIYFQGKVTGGANGNSSFVDSVSVATAEVNELRSAGYSIVLMVPSGEYGTENGCWSQLTTSWLTKAVNRVKQEAGKNLSKIILVGHDCGYNAINKNSSFPGVYKIVLLDGMYSSFINSAQNKNIIFAAISTNHDGVRANTEAFYSSFFTVTPISWNNMQYVTADKRVALYTKPSVSEHMSIRGGLSDLYKIKTDSVKTDTKKKEPTKDELESTTSKTNPLLSVQIPGLGVFSPIKCEVTGGKEGYCNIPWLGEYISALYNYGVKVVAVLAVVMIMVGGWRWIFAGGNAARIGAAKKVIASAIIGLILMLTSYMLLTVINPSLLSMDSISLTKKFYTKEEIEAVLKDTYALSTVDLEEATNPPPDGTNVKSLGSGVSVQVSSIGKDGVPLLRQCKDPKNHDIDYTGKGCQTKSNICSSGCGVTSLTMVLLYYQKPVTLQQMAQKMINNGGRGCDGGTSQLSIGQVAKEYGLRVQECNNYDNCAELAKTNPVVISVHNNPLCKNDNTCYKSRKCPFTGNGHFIVITKNHDGILNINDPAGKGGTSISLSDLKKSCTFGSGGKAIGR